MANFFFGGVLAILVTHHVYYILWHKGFFTDYPFVIHCIKPFTTLAPFFIWYYAVAFVTGRIYSFGKISRHLIPVYMLIILFIPLIFAQFIFQNEQILSFMLIYNKIYGIISYLLIGGFFIYFSYDILDKLYKTCSKKAGFWNNLLDFSNDRILLVKVLAVIIFTTGIVSVFQALFEIIGTWGNTFYYAESIVILIIGYWFMFVIIYNPKIIHFKMKEIKAGGKLVGYENSGLAENEAIDIMKRMNKWMESEKPFINGNLTLTDFAEKFEIPGYILSEILNRLLKQNFYEYVNNYRVEEFKRLLVHPDYRNIKLLNIAFDVGFNSKTTFNSSFKKFTGLTPSEYRNSVI